MQIIPLQPLPSQIVSVDLADQACQIQVVQKSSGLFVNLYVNNALVIGGVISENLNPIVRSLYLGFIGDLAWIDVKGRADPEYTLIGTKYFLAYFTPDEVPILEEVADVIVSGDGIALESGLGFWELESAAGNWTWG